MLLLMVQCAIHTSCQHWRSAGGRSLRIAGPIKPVLSDAWNVCARVLCSQVVGVQVHPACSFAAGKVDGDAVGSQNTVVLTRRQ